MQSVEDAGSIVPNDRLALVDQVFTPATPVKTSALFAGRRPQIDKVLTTLMEPGRHAILFGERGVGKTSLANIVSEKLVQQAAIVPKVSADSDDSFTTLWDKVFKRITVSAAKQGAGFMPKRQIELKKLSERSRRALSPDDVADLLSRLPFTVPVIDEFDRLLSEDVGLLVADTIKLLSDSGTGATILIVGVGHDVTDLISHHPSIERCIRQIHLQRMEPNELEEILDNGFNRLDLHADTELKRKMVNLSHGFPHYTHALGKYSALSALEAGNNDVSYADFLSGVRNAIDDTHESIQRSYLDIMSEGSQEALPFITLAAAVANEDLHGTFRMTDLRESMSLLGRRPFPGRRRFRPFRFEHYLDKLTTEEGGKVLERVGRPGSNRFRFQSPLMKPYIIMQAYKGGALGDDVLDRLV
jgi:AAA domain